MKLFASLLNVFVAIAFVGSATGDATLDVGSATSDATLDIGATECSLVPEEGASVNDTMYNKVEDCFYAIGYEHMGSNPPVELIRTTFAAFCGRINEVSPCIQKLEAEARACLDESQYTRYRLYHQYMQLDNEIGCEENGADFAVTYRDNILGENQILKACQDGATAQLGEIDEVTPNGFMVHKYKEMQKTVNCLNEHNDPGHDLTWAITSYTKEMDRLMCVKDGADVLCKTIVNNH